jgi:acyl carrier protein
MASDSEVFEKVKAELVAALGADEDEVTPEATIIGDLGAESIDFLDIVFRLEKAFNISIKREELSPEDLLTSDKFVQGGLLNAEGLSALRSRMPWADLSKFAENPRVQNFGNMLTVSDLCRFVGSKLN